MEAQVTARKQLLGELDDLYRSAFTGPTTDFPEEDAAEDALKDAERHFEQVQSQINHEQAVLAALDRATTCAAQTVAALRSVSSQIIHLVLYSPSDDLLRHLETQLLIPWDSLIYGLNWPSVMTYLEHRRPHPKPNAFCSELDNWTQESRIFLRRTSLQRELQRGLMIQVNSLITREWLNVVFDNLYTDYLFKRKPRPSSSEFAHVTHFLNREG